MSSSWHMGFRKPVRSRSQLLASVSTQKGERKKCKPKPAWDNTVKDLTVFKPSPQELHRNHLLHQPKKDHERLIRRINSAKFMLNDTDTSHFDASPDPIERKRALIKEIFYNREREVQDVLAETDRTIADVKDIFGDDAAQKYKGKPNVVRAPQYKNNMDSFIAQLDTQAPSYYDTLSESVMINPALNDLSDEDGASECDDEEDTSSGRNKRETFETRLDMNRYQELVKESTQQPRTSSTALDVNSLSKFRTVLQDETATTRDEKPVANKDPDAAKGRKKKSSTSNDTFQPFDDMKKMLDALEQEISEYEKESGKENIVKKYQIPNTLTGYTTNLLSTVVRIVHHLKESEKQLRAEMSMRKEILEAFEEQRGLLDALTADLLETQETNEVLKHELELQKKTNQTQYASLKMDVTKLERKLNELLSNNYHTQQNDFHKHPLHDISNLSRPKQQNIKVSPSISPVSFT